MKYSKWYGGKHINHIGRVMDIFAVEVMNTGYDLVVVAYKLKWWSASTASGVIAPLWLEPL